MYRSIMLTIILILAKLEFLAGMLQNEQEESEIVHNQQNNSQLEKPIRLIKYSPNMKVVNDFFDSLNIISGMADTLIQHIQNLRHAHEYSSFCIHSLPSFAEHIQVITKLRKTSENDHVFKYEFIKFCELFYHTLFYIMKHRKEFLIDFLPFLQKKILPHIKSIKKIINYYKSSKFLYWLNAKFQNEKRQNDADHRHSLSNFCFKLLKIDNEELFYEQIDKNYSTDELPVLCTNIFLRIFLLNPHKYKMYSEFSAEKYPVSRVFVNFLFYDCNLTIMTTGVRTILREFTMNNHIFLERQLVLQNIIPSVVDVINRHSLNFNLFPIG